jgi:hypothetical protein
MNIPFEFNGDWETVINLQRLSFLNDDKLLTYFDDVKEKLEKGLVTLYISDSVDLNPEPTSEQLETLFFIQKNEEVILETIFEHVNKVVYPHMKTLIDDEEYWFPIMETKEDVKKTLALTSIQILNLCKDNYAYCSMNFQSSWENEHGFSILFHKNRILSTGEAGGFDIFKIWEECDLNGVEESYKFNHWNDNIFEFLEPHPKYGKRMPLQKSSNALLPFRLIKNGLEEKLYTYISNGSINIDFNGSGISMLSMAIQAENFNIVNFFIQHKIKNLFVVESALAQVQNNEIRNIVQQYLTEQKL